MISKKDFFKLMNNSVFGKSMENIRNCVDIKLCSNEKKLKKHITKSNFDSTVFYRKFKCYSYEETKICLINQSILACAF